jgi:acetyl-CoA carboxylase biotin carboxylase subunit
MVTRVLVANRGEIANRLCSHIRTLGYESVAVFSEADAGAPHTQAANCALPIGPSPVTESYLRADRILEAAQESGADAIHPGYGLLSENADFARAVVDRGLTWIGPPPTAIERMGDKGEAIRTARQLGLPLIPGSDGPLTAADDPEAIAEKLGFPVLVKASAGGGGIGMEVAKKPEKLGKAIQKCRDRSARAFGSDEVYLEKYLSAPRHIEIQILVDKHGNGVSLYERECSIQRRYQKIVEEAPSLVCSEISGLRERMGKAALTLAHAVGYEGVGTVEFLVDETGDFYFMEMNTRLQVEHPVTECVTGIDLIDWQLRVANGEVLNVAPQLSGHAIECRIYAEDPANRFLPRPGTITELVWPEDEGVRVDSGVEVGSVVTPYYDPLMAKLIVTGTDRRDAINRLTNALEKTRIDGVTTNLSFHRWLVTNEAFIQGDLSTQFVRRHFNTG